MIVSNQLSTHQNYSNMQSYGYQTLYVPVSSGNRLYTHVDGSIRIQEKPLGYVIGEGLLHAAKKLDTIISLVVPSLPGANASPPRPPRILLDKDRSLLDEELKRREEEKQMSTTTATSSTENKKLSTYPPTQASKDTQQKEKERHCQSLLSRYRVYTIVSSATAGIFAVPAIVILAYKIMKSKMCRGKQNSGNNLEEEELSFIDHPPPPLPLPMDLIPSETLK